MWFEKIKIQVCNTYTDYFSDIMIGVGGGVAWMAQPLIGVLVGLSALILAVYKVQLKKKEKRNKDLEADKTKKETELLIERHALESELTRRELNNQKLQEEAHMADLTNSAYQRAIMDLEILKGGKDSLIFEGDGCDEKDLLIKNKARLEDFAERIQEMIKEKYSDEKGI